MGDAEKQSARFEFPSMLYDMLEEVSDDPETSHVVSWVSHGRAFKVHKPSKFEVTVMPNYFRERYASFRFLLEQWGFQGLRGKDRGAYYNAHFVRGERQRIAEATKQFMLSAMPESLARENEPDFDNMPRVLSTKTTSKDAPPSTRKRKGDDISNRRTSKKVKTQQINGRGGEPPVDVDGIIEESPTHELEHTRERRSSGVSRSTAGTKRSSNRSSSSKRSQQQARTDLRTHSRLMPSQQGTSSSERDGSHQDEADALESSCIPLPPAKVVFGGFNFKSKKPKSLTVVRNSLLPEIDPFVVKRPGAGKKKNRVSPRRSAMARGPIERPTEESMIKSGGCLAFDGAEDQMKGRDDGEAILHRTQRLASVSLCQYYVPPIQW